MNESPFTRLSVNLNAVAYLRNRRSMPWPDLATIAVDVLEAGAHGITVHPRPDQRHVTLEDVDVLNQLIRRDFPRAEFNIEGYPSEEFLQLIEKTQPSQATLVPDSPDQATSDHGWDLIKNSAIVGEAIARLQKAGVRVSIFVDASPQSVTAVRDLNGDRVELFTGPFGAAANETLREAELATLARAADEAHRPSSISDRNSPLGVNAGHDLTLENLPQLMTKVGNISEVSIGHALASDALRVGYAEATRRFLKTLSLYAMK